MAENIIFAKAHIYSEIDGTEFEFGECQEVSIEKRDTTKQARGPDSLYPLVSEISESAMTVRAAFLKVTAQALARLTGGDVTYADGKTEIEIAADAIPATFKMTLKSPSTGEDAELILYAVRPVNLALPFAMREFTVPNFECEVMQDENEKVCKLILPGYQSLQ